MLKNQSFFGFTPESLPESMRVTNQKPLVEIVGIGFKINIPKIARTVDEASGKIVRVKWNKPTEVTLHNVPSDLTAYVVEHYLNLRSFNELKEQKVKLEEQVRTKNFLAKARAKAIEKELTRIKEQLHFTESVLVDNL